MNNPVRLLLDCHSLLWWLSQPEMLSDESRQAIADPLNEVFVSAASTWEIAIKTSLGRLKVPDDLELQIRAARFTELPVAFRHGLAAADLPFIHADPFDRMLVVQARMEGLTLVTRDRIIPRYDVDILRA